MTIHLGADHAGYQLKEEIKKWLVKQNYKVKDYGAFEYNKDDDYPDFTHPVGRAVAKDKKSRGIVLGASGQGEAMVCNRYRGVRAAVYDGGPLEIIKLSRQHNNANVLSLGARFVDKKTALKAVALWLKTDFDQKVVRHTRRIRGIDPVLQL